jgi:hypothetical protein
LTSPLRQAASDLIWDTGFLSAQEWILGTDQSLFIHGRAGSGKSTLLRWIRRQLGSGAVVLAPTGVAALEAGGETLHQFFRLPPRLLPPFELPPGSPRALWKALHTLVLDEISMVRADIFEAVESLLRRYGPHPGETFGGVRLILVGDPCQLPPVCAPGEAETLKRWGFAGPWFFQAPAYSRVSWKSVDLPGGYRQQDQTFLSALDALRLGCWETHHESFWASRASRVSKGMPGLHNSQTLHSSGWSEIQTHAGVTLTSTHAVARKFNEQVMKELPEPEGVFLALGPNHFPNDFPKEFPVPYELKLRIGAQVMFQRNDAERRWVNGTAGVVVGWDSEAIFVSVEDLIEPLCVKRETWRRLRYQENLSGSGLEEMEEGRWEQFPLKPAWALTVHKSQGKTFSRVAVDLGKGAFEHGQAYVALSRCSSWDGLTLLRPLRQRDFFFDTAVGTFLTGLV